MAAPELLKSKAVKGLTKCSLGILVFTVIIEGIVALVVTCDGSKKVCGGLTSDSSRILIQKHLSDTTYMQVRLLPCSTVVDSAGLANLVYAKLTPRLCTRCSPPHILPNGQLLLICFLTYFPILVLGVYFLMIVILVIVVTIWWIDECKKPETK